MSEPKKRTSGKGGKNPASARRARGQVRWDVWVSAELDARCRDSAQELGMSLTEWLVMVAVEALR